MRAIRSVKFSTLAIAAAFSVVDVPLLSGGPASPEFFVSTNGDDTADGISIDTSLRSITEALGRADSAGGAVIRVLPGTYDAATEVFPLEPSANTHVVAYDPDDKPRIGGTIDYPVFWIRDIPADIVPWPEEGEPPWPEPDPHAPVLSGLRIHDGGQCPGGVGGGVKLTRGSVHLIDCDIVENHTGLRGAGISAEESSKLIAERCRISRNFKCSVFVNNGTAVWLEQGSVVALDRCELYHNVSNEGTAGIDADMDCQLFLRDSHVLDNHGGALRAFGSSNVSISRCVISGHLNCPCPGLAPLTVNRGHLILKDSLIYANGDAIGILIGSESTARIDGCVVTHNEGGGPLCSGGEGLAASSPSYVEISNSIFWANNRLGNEWRDIGCHFPPRLPTVRLDAGIIRHSIVERSTPPFDDYPLGFTVHHVNVIDADPRFRDPRAGDFSLLPGSPAIDAGDPDAPLDPDGTRRDIGVTFPDIVPRYVFTRGDPSGDGIISITDGFKIVLGLFVDPVHLPCPDAADYDDNGQLDILDVLQTLNFIFHFPQPGPAMPYPGWGPDYFDDDPLGCDWGAGG